MKITYIDVCYLLEGRGVMEIISKRLAHFPRPVCHCLFKTSMVKLTFRCQNALAKLGA